MKKNKFEKEREEIENFYDDIKKKVDITVYHEDSNEWE